MMKDVGDACAGQTANPLLSFFAFGLIFFMLAIYTYCVSQKGHVYKMMVGVFSCLLALVPGLLVVGLSHLQLGGLGYDVDLLRISLSTGFWLLLAGVVFLQQMTPLGKWHSLLTILFLMFTMFSGWSPLLSLFKEFQNVREVFVAEFIRHIKLSFGAIVFASLPGMLLGYWSYRNLKAREVVFGVVNFFQVIPTLSLLGLLMIPLTMISNKWPMLAALGIKGIGFAPALIALTLYGLLPITANALAGFEKVNPSVLDSAIAMGMTDKQVLWRVSVPLAFPVILSGIRIAAIQTIGNTILAGLIGGGGMGTLIFLGLSQTATDLVLLGTMPVVLLALCVDGIFEGIEKRLARKGGGFNDSVKSS